MVWQKWERMPYDFFHKTICFIQMIYINFRLMRFHKQYEVLLIHSNEINLTEHQSGWISLFVIHTHTQQWYKKMAAENRTYPIKIDYSVISPFVISPIDNAPKFIIQFNPAGQLIIWVYFSVICVYSECDSFFFCCSDSIKLVNCF